MFYFEAEQETAADEDSVSHVGLLAAAQMEDAEGDVARMREDEAKDDAKDEAKDDVEDDVARMREDDAVFKATMFQLLRRQSVDRVDLQHVADTRSKYFLGFIDIFKNCFTRWSGFADFERRVGDTTIMRGRRGIVGDILPGLKGIFIAYQLILKLSDLNSHCRELYSGGAVAGV